LSQVPGENGTDVVVVFTDIEGSTPLWEAAPSAMRLALAMHDATLRELLARHDGYEVKTEGDAFMVTFGDSRSALSWGLDVQRLLARVDWPQELLGLPSARPRNGVPGIRVRIGMHVGSVDMQTNPVTGRADYFGRTVNRAARIAAAAHGGQIIVSNTLVDSAKERDDATVAGLGTHRLKGLGGEVVLHQVTCHTHIRRSFPLPRTSMRLTGKKQVVETRRMTTVAQELSEQLLARGEARRIQGDLDLASKDLKAVLQLTDVISLPEIRTRATYHLAAVRHGQGKLQLAARGFQVTVKGAQAIGDKWLEASAIGGMGIVQMVMGQPKLARAALTKAAEMHKEQGNTRQQGRDELHLGVLSRRTGDYRAAAMHYARAQGLLDKAAAASMASACATNRAVLAEHMGSPDALSLTRDALSRAREIGFENAISTNLYNLAGILVADGAFDEARTTVANGMQRTGEHEISQRLRVLDGVLDVVGGKVDDGEEKIAGGLRDLNASGEAEGITWALTWMALVHAFRGDIKGTQRVVLRVEELTADAGLDPFHTGIAQTWEALAKRDMASLTQHLAGLPRHGSAGIAQSVVTELAKAINA
jgi:class 3 adenylate cyclase/tetratricopeptide (TPR) repeat protein